MKNNLALLALTIAITNPAFATDPAPKGIAKKEGASAATPVAATPTAGKADINNTSNAKRNVAPAVAKESTRDPYEVPLLKGAKPLNGYYN